MKIRTISSKLITLIAVVIFPVLFVNAQEDEQNERPGRQRPNLIRELGLTPEQIKQVRQINQETKPLMAAAQDRLRNANRALDVSIYSDGVQQTDVNQRLTDFQAAQAEVAKIRFMKELAVRKILTAEQLTQFREMRKRFGEARENMQERRRGKRDIRMQRRMDRPVRPVVND
ncbi:MAG: hypothetical protein WKF92_01575 [Pyrinomonadaceae bacterium]